MGHGMFIVIVLTGIVCISATNANYYPEMYDNTLGYGSSGIPGCHCSCDQTIPKRHVNTLPAILPRRRKKHKAKIPEPVPFAEPRVSSGILSNPISRARSSIQSKHETPIISDHRSPVRKMPSQLPAVVAPVRQDILPVTRPALGKRRWSKKKNKKGSHIGLGVAHLKYRKYSRYDNSFIDNGFQNELGSSLGLDNGNGNIINGDSLGNANNIDIGTGNGFSSRFDNGNPFNDNGFGNGNVLSNGNGFDNGNPFNGNGFDNGNAFNNDNGVENGISFNNGNGVDNGNSFNNGNGFDNGNAFNNDNGFDNINGNVISGFAGIQAGAGRVAGNGADGLIAGPSGGVLGGARVDLNGGVLGGARADLNDGVLDGARDDLNGGVLGGARADLNGGVLGGARVDLNGGVLGGARADLTGGLIAGHSGGALKGSATNIAGGLINEPSRVAILGLENQLINDGFSNIGRRRLPTGNRRKHKNSSHGRRHKKRKYYY